MFSPVEVVHDDCCDECLAQASGKTHESVVEQAGLDDVVLVISVTHVGGVDPSLPRLNIKSWQVFNWSCFCHLSLHLSVKLFLKHIKIYCLHLFHLDLNSYSES